MLYIKCFLLAFYMLYVGPENSEHAFFQKETQGGARLSVAGLLKANKKLTWMVNK